MSTQRSALALGLTIALAAANLVLAGAGLRVRRGADTSVGPYQDEEQSDRRATLATAFADIDRLILDFTTRSFVPGAAWGIIVDGELAHVGTTGLRDIPSKSPVDGDTVFRIASMTKSFTAVSILKLRDEGKLSLDDPAERYVPEMKALRYPTTDSPRITIRHLLSHSEGFPEDNPWGDQQLADTEEQLSEMLRRGIPFSNAPGIAYEYSNLGFAILGRIVANVSRMKYGDYVAANILRPLGMTATTLEPSAVPALRLAHGYRWEDEQWKNEPLLANGSFGSMGGMLTSVRDLSRWVAMFLSAWPPHDGPEDAPIRRSSLREMQQLWRPGATSVTRDGSSGALQLNTGGYAFGLGVSTTCSFRHIVAHSGGLPGFGSVMRWLPEYGVGFVAFGSLTYTSWGRVTSDVFDRLAKTGGLERRMPDASPALNEMRDAVSRLVVRWDDGLADRIAAGNLFLDQSKERRRAQIESLHAQYREAHDAGWTPFGRVDPSLASAFERTQRELGATSTAVPGRPKASLLNVYFRRAGVAGMTDPYFLETLVQRELLPFERPIIVAHEWSHLAGYNDESEANFVGWLTCLRASTPNQYSGWLFLYTELAGAVRPRDRGDLAARLAPGPRADLQAIAERIRRQVSPAISTAGWRVYDRYLKANRVEAGAASYAEVVRLVLGTAFVDDWKPRLR